MATTRWVADGTPVEWHEAVATWAAEARPVLQRAAGQYNAFFTYQQLAEAVQEDTGIETGVPFRHWIGSVLGSVAEDQRVDEPILTSPVVRADGSVGEGYSIPVKAREGVIPEDLDRHAANERLACYRFFGAELPPNGGTRTLTPAVAQRRRNRRPKEQRPTGICPTCGIGVPASGVCDFCDTDAR